MTDAEIIHELYAENMPLRRIAKKMEMYVIEVKDVLGFPRHVPNRQCKRLTPEQSAEIKALALEGKGSTTIRRIMQERHQRTFAMSCIQRHMKG